MSDKHHRPRRKDNKLSFELIVRDGNTPILEFRNQKITALDEVLELLDKKL